MHVELRHVDTIVAFLDSCEWENMGKHGTAVLLGDTVGASLLDKFNKFTAAKPLKSQPHWQD